MDYTPQQLMGHKSYNPKVRIGNWNEDVQLHDTRFNEFMRAKENNALPSHQMKRKFEHHLAPVQVADVAEHGNVQFGDRLLIQNLQNHAYLAMDLDTKLHHVYERFGITATKPRTNEQTPAISRSVFIIERVPSKDDIFYTNEHEEHLLHYGQHFKLKSVPEFHDNLYFRSEKATPSCHSTITHNQEVSVDTASNFQSEWALAFIDPKFRFEMEGEPVPVNTAFLLVHCATNQNLMSNDQNLVLNDFGKEFEVCCKTLLDSHKAEQSCNQWSFMYPSSE
jgi:hypothetical protein